MRNFNQNSSYYLAELLSEINYFKILLLEIYVKTHTLEI